jgi:hypothetical protein
MTKKHVDLNRRACYLIAFIEQLACPLSISGISGVDVLYESNVVGFFFWLTHLASVSLLYQTGVKRELLDTPGLECPSVS